MGDYFLRKWEDSSKTLES